jgi:hypothetical protein
MLLAVAIAITFMAPVAASSSTAVDKGLENAIKSVKERISIPQECSTFSYDINMYNGKNQWNLGWTNKEDNQNINVTIDEDNFISNYYSYKYSQYEKKVPKYSKEQGRELAEKFINKINPKLLSQYKYTENNYSYGSDNEYYYNYVREVNGITYNANSMAITVNKQTGDILSYSCSYDKNVIFQDASKIITLEQAKKAFTEKLGLKLVYKTKTENDKDSTYLAYIPKSSYKYIDAATGEVKNETYGMVSYDKEMAYNMSAGGMGDSTKVQLTPDELEAVKNMSDILSKEDADKKVHAISLLNLDSTYTLSAAYLNKNWRNGNSFIWYLSYVKNISEDEKRYVSVSIDAKTGDVISFDCSYPSAKDAKPQKTKEEAQEICNNAIKNLIPNIYGNLKYNDLYYNIYNTENNNQYTFNFVRVENGVEFPDNYVNITYDNLSGNVCSMDITWNKDIKFDKPDPKITLEKAYEILFSKIGYDIKYINEYTNTDSDSLLKLEQNGNYKAVLGYLINNSIPNVISASTGDILNSSGDVYKPNKKLSDYTDIKGLKNENQIEILTQMSIRYFGDELKPSDKLLQKDYFLILSQLNNLIYINDNETDEKIIDEMYNTLLNQGIITKEEKAPLSVLTREQAAKYFVRFLRLGNVAEIKGIYKSNFKDASKINPDLLGYVCLASGLKAMNGSNGNFNPKGKMTKLEGLLSIYSYLSNR